MAAEQRSAWLFDFGAGLRAAVGGQHLAEYLRAPEVVEVPLAPAVARGVLVWRERLVPLLDLGRLAGNDDGRGEPVGAIVLAYRQTPESPLQYGALALAAAPREIGVRDDLACDLPAEPAFWGALAASCITCEDRPTPILRVRNIFTRALAAPDAPLRATPAAAMPVVEPEIGANTIRAVDDAFVPRLELVGDTAAGGGSVAEDVAVKTFEAGTAPPERVLAPLPIVAPGETAAAAVEPAGTAEPSAPAAAATHAPEENILDDVPMPHRAAAEILQADAPWPDPPQADAPAPAQGYPSKAQGTFSRSVHFYRRLREIARRHRLPEPRRFWPPLATAAAAVLAVFLLWNLFAAPKETPVPDNASSRAQPVVNVAPAKIGPAAIPAAPVQPPK